MSEELDELLDLLESIENRLSAKDTLTPEEQQLLEDAKRRRKQGIALKEARE